MLQTYYNELKITTFLYKKEFIDFLFSLGIEAIEERDNGIIVRSEESLEDVEWGVCEFAKKLQNLYKKEIDLTTSIEQKVNEDWIDKYKNSVDPIEVGDFYIHPSWKNPKENLTNIIIDPALAFGSGHHETTYSSLLMLQKYLQKDDTLLDVGCGSGILSIASIKLGAKVDSCDTDEQALQSALQNAKLNSCEIKKAWVGSVTDADKKYDVIVANIVADILIVLQKSLEGSLNENGYLILSGVLDKYEQNVMNAFKNLSHKETHLRNEWCTIVFKK